MFEASMLMRKEIAKWFKKHATIAKVGGLLVFLGLYGGYVRDLQKDLDEVRYSKQINELEKIHSKEIEEYKQKINTLRDENLKMKMEQLQLMEEYFNKKGQATSEKEVSYEKK